MDTTKQRANLKVIPDHDNDSVFIEVRPFEVQKPLSLFVWGVFATIFSWIGFSIILCMATESLQEGMILAIFPAVGAFFLATYVKDKRTNVSFSKMSASITGVCNYREDEENQIRAPDVTHFTLKNQLTQQSVDIPTYQHGGPSMLSSLGVGVVAESLMGTRAVPGAVGGAIGGMHAGVNAFAAVYTGTINGTRTKLMEARQEYKNLLSEHSFVVMAHSKDRVVRLCSGVDYDSALVIMKTLDQMLDKVAGKAAMLRAAGHKL